MIAPELRISTTTVGEFLRLRYGKALAADQRGPNGQFPVLGSAGRMAATNTPLTTAPVVLIGRKGNVGAISFEADGCWPIDTTYYAEIPENTDARFLMHQLRALDLKRLDSSTATPSLRRQDLEAQLLWIPPLVDQRRIVDVLEDHLSRLDAAQTYLATADRRARAWSAGLVDQALWNHRWPTKPVAELLREPMRNGRSDRSSEGQPGVRTLTLTAVTRNEFVDSFTKVTSTTEERAVGLWLEPGDILVQRSNTPELVGTAARFDGERNWAIFPDLLIRLRADEDVIDSRLLVAALRAERTHRTLRGRAKGLAGSMPKIDQAAIAGTHIPVPPLSEQGGLVEQLGEVRRREADLRAGISRQVARSGSLRRGLLAAAFSGRLTERHTDQEVIEELADV